MAGRTHSTHLSEQHVDAFKHWLHSFLPGPVNIDGKEKFRACCGALIGIFVTGALSRWALGSSEALLLAAPMGASAVLLFAVPSSPLAQPWSIIGGNTISAAIGVSCALWFAEPMVAAAAAVSGAIAAMFACRCLHPPGGAVALTAVLGGPMVDSLGYQFVLTPILLNSVLLLVLAVLYNNATARRYPHASQPDHGNMHHTADLLPNDRLGFTPEDLDEVLKEYNQILDVSREDLETLFLETEMHVYRRRFGQLTCADIMSKDVVTVNEKASLRDAWLLLRWHRIKALPVIDAALHVTGIITETDFIRHVDIDTGTASPGMLGRFLPRIVGRHPKTVGDIMTAPADVATSSTHIVHLVPLMPDAGVHHIVIVDAEKRLAGVVTQSDLVAALYRSRLYESAARA